MNFDHERWLHCPQRSLRPPPPSPNEFDKKYDEEKEEDNDDDVKEEDKDDDTDSGGKDDEEKGEDDTDLDNINVVVYHHDIEKSMKELEVKVMKTSEHKKGETSSQAMVNQISRDQSWHY